MDHIKFIDDLIICCELEYDLLTTSEAREHNKKKIITLKEIKEKLLQLDLINKNSKN